MDSIKEISRREEKTVKTLCILSLKDKDGNIIEKEVEISHFMPNSEDDIILGCTNRLASEQRAIDEKVEEEVKE